jgi:hypothetical protein
LPVEEGSAAAKAAGEMSISMVRVEPFTEVFIAILRGGS